MTITKAYSAIIILRVALFTSLLNYAFGDLKFESLTTKDGLSHNWVNDILRDSKGYLWIATEYGLNRYDGYKFHHYFHETKDLNSISGDRQSKLIEDHLGRIWVGAGKSGVDVYDFATDRFERISTEHLQISPTAYIDDIIEVDRNRIWISYRHLGIIEIDSISMKPRLLRNIHTSKELPFRYVRGMTKTINGDIWLGTEGDFVVQYSPIDDDFLVHNLKAVEYSPDQNPIASTKSLFADDNGTLWITSESNFPLIHYNPENRSTTHYTVKDDGTGLNYRQIEDILRIDEHTLWIATDNGGINILDERTGRFKYVKKNESDPYSITSNGIFRIFKDNFGIIWVGTFDGGISYLDPSHNQFKTYYAIYGDPESLRNNNVNEIIEGSDEKIWVGTDGGGLHLLDPKKERFIDDAIDLPPQLKSVQYITALAYTKNGKLLVGTFLEGFFLYDTINGDCLQFSPNTHPELPFSSVWDFAETPDGKILIASHYIAIFDIETMSILPISPFEGKTDLYRSEAIPSVICSPENEIFWSSGDGFSQYNLNTNDYFHFPNNTNLPNPTPFTGITSLALDKGGHIWLGSSQGLIEFNPKLNTYEVFSTLDELPSNKVYKVIPFDENEVWISTARGICRFDRKNQKGYAYHPGNGLQGWHYNINSGTLASDGTLFFGGTNGLDLINPEYITPTISNPAIVFTEFQISYENRPVLTSNGQMVIDCANEIILRPNDRTFSIGFASLDITNTPYLKYRFKLEGFQNDWVEVGFDQNRAYYSNLPGGSYVFKVESSNANGQWVDNERSISIRVKPPFYRTLWFTMACTSILIMLIWGFIRYRTHFLEGAKIKAENADKLKSLFLANMSHEIRTPLNAIVGFLSIMEEEVSEKKRAVYKGYIEESSKDLMNIIEDILDISSLEAGAVKIYNNCVEVNKVLAELEQIHQNVITSRNKEIKLTSIFPNSSLVLQTDKLRFRQVMNNLLSNAIKFTDKGSIEFGYSELSDHVEFFVRDTGIGIDSDELKSIFDPFVRSKETAQKTYRGTGLGLAISKKFLNLMGGNISVSSEVGKGSTFRFSLPKNGESYVKIEPSALTPVANKAPDLSQYVIAVAEDNPFNRKLIELLLQKTGAIVLLAEDGEELIDIVSKSEKIDLILTDIKMPRMGGLEATRIIRKFDPAIPIIAQSAFAMSVEKRIFTDAGGSDFIRKPIKKSELYNILDIHLNYR